MKFPKAIFIDVDGTLLNSEHQITDETYASIQRLIKRNYLVVLATARPPDAVFFIAKELRIFHFPIICLNGALIYEKEQMVFEKGIALGDVKILLEKISKDITLNFLQKRKWFVNRVDEFITKEMQITGMKAEERQIKDLLLDWEKNKSEVHKILCISTAKKMETLRKKLNQEVFSNLNIYPSKPTYLEITHELSSKKIAMHWVLQKFNIPNSNSIALGDGHNDADMLKAVGLGIAMGNAPVEVKSFADFVTLSNDQNGLTHALKFLNII